MENAAFINWYLIIWASKTLSNYFRLICASLLDLLVLIILRQPRLPLLVHEQEELDTHFGSRLYYGS